MIFLWNATNDDMDFGYGGLSYTILAGKRMKVDEAMGRHVLNNLGARGLTKLVFDDDGKSINEEKIEADAKERCKEFKIRQIVTYNERNERRKASGQPYDVPTKDVKKYAIELGIDLLQPYTMSDGEKGQIGKLSQENAELKTQMATIMNQMQTMMSSIALQPQKVEANRKGMVECGVCGEWLPENRIKTHIRFKHNFNKEVKDDAEPVPI